MYRWCDSKSVYDNICSFRIFETSKLIPIRTTGNILIQRHFMNLGFNLKKKKENHTLYF